MTSQSTRIPAVPSESLPLPPTDSFTVTVETPPKVISAYTRDLTQADGASGPNGLLDAFDLTFDKDVDFDTLVFSEWKMDTMSASGASKLSDTKVRLTFDESAFTTAEVPELTYQTSQPTFAGKHGTLVAFVNTDSVQEFDGARPALTSAKTVGNANGRLDAIILEFSEDLDPSSGPNQLNFEIGSDSKKPTAALIVDGSPHTLRLTLPDEWGTGDKPQVSYTGNLADSQGNMLRGSSDNIAWTPEDDAAPVALSVTTDDTDADGSIDQIVITFSEDLANPNDDDFKDYFSIDAPFTIDTLVLAGSTFTLSVTGGETYDTDATPLITYSENGPALTDTAGNVLANAIPDTTDGAPPVLLHALILVGSPILQAVFSETVQSESGGVLGADAFTSSWDSKTMLSVDHQPDDRVVRITFEEDFTEEDAEGATFAPVDSGVFDTAASPNAATLGVAVEVKQLKVESAEMIGNSLGFLAAVNVRFSIPVDSTSVDPATWTVEGYLVEDAQLSNDGMLVALTLTPQEGTLPDTGFTPEVVYTAGTSPLQDAAGEVSLEDGTTTTPEDMADVVFLYAETFDVAGNLLLPLVDYVSTDNAPPVLLSATSAGFDSTQVTLIFSEPVKGSGEGGALVAGDLAYADAGGGASGIAAVSHAGSLATLTLDAGFVDVDNFADTVAAISSKITDAVGLAAPSVPVFVSTETTPPAPLQDLALGAVTANSIGLVFTAVADDGTDPESGPAVAYLVKVAEAPITTEAEWSAATEAPVSKFPGAPGSAETLTITGLEPQTTYHVAIRAMDKAGNKGDLRTITATTIVDNTPPPGTLTITSQSHTFGQASSKTTATLSWNQMSDPESTVTYHYKVTDQSAYTVMKTDSATTAASFMHSSLADGTHYVHVAAFSVGGSKQADPFKLVIDTVAPARINDLAASDAGPLSITLTWTAPGDNGDAGTAADYQVYRSGEAFTANNLADVPLATGVAAPAVAGTKQSFEVTGLTPDTEYHFAIRARDAAGNKGQLSSILLAATEPDTTPPVGALDLVSTTHDDGVKSNRRDVEFTWTAASDPETAVVYRYALMQDAQYTLSDDDATTEETNVDFADVEPGQWIFMVAAESAGGRSSAQSFIVVILGISDSDIEVANGQVITKVTRRGAHNVIDWVLPTNTPADVQGVQVLRCNSPFQVIATISSNDAAYTSGRFVDDSDDARTTSRYLVTMYYGNSASLGKQPEGQEVQMSEPLNDIGVAPSSESRGYDRPVFYVGLLAVIAIVGLAIVGIVRFSRGRDGGDGP